MQTSVLVQGKRKKARRLGDLPLHLMIIPAVLIVAVYCYIPMFGVLIAFQKFDIIKGMSGFFTSEWVGLQHYRDLIEMGDVPMILGNTFRISFLKIASLFVIPIITAILLNEVRVSWLKRGIQTMIYMPHFLSWVILAGVLKQLLALDGTVNAVITSITGSDPIPFLQSNTWFVPVIILTNVWKEFGFSTIIYLAAITNIDPTYYEAAIVDGAGWLKRVWHVTLPGMRPIIILTLVLSLGNITNAGFDQIFNLYSVQVYQTADIIDTYMYRIGFEQAMYDKGAAVGLFNSLVSLVFISASYWFAYKFANYEIF